MSSKELPAKAEDLASLTKLVVGSKEEIENLGSYRNLVELDVARNAVSDELKGIKSLKMLKKLTLSDNQIRTCFEMPPNIESLSLSSNILTRIDPALLALRKLTFLDLSHNFISDVSGLERLSQLKHLFLRENQVSEISCLLKLGNLLELDCEANAIYCSRSTKLWDQHKSLQVFNLRGNPVLSLLHGSKKEFLTKMSYSDDGIFAANEKVFKASQIHLTNQREDREEPLNFSDFDDQNTEEELNSESLPDASQRSTHRVDMLCMSPVFAGGEQPKPGSGKREAGLNKPKINEAIEDHSLVSEKREKKVFVKKMDFGHVANEKERLNGEGLRAQRGEEPRALEKLKLPQNELSKMEAGSSSELVRNLRKENSDLKKQMSLEMEGHKEIVGALTVGFWSVAELVGMSEENLRLFDFQALRRLLQEKLDSTKLETSERVLKKFDELSQHYRAKEEQLLMRLSDLESKLGIAVPVYIKEMKAKIERDAKAQYQRLFMKYTEMRKSMENSLNETLKQESDGLGNLDVKKLRGLRNENQILKKNLLEISVEYEKLFKRKSSYLDSMENSYISKIRELQNENMRLAKLRENARNHQRMNSVNISRIPQDSFSMDAGRSHFAGCSQMEDVIPLLGESEQKSAAQDQSAIKMMNLVIKNLRYKLKKLEEKLAECKENHCVCVGKEERTTLSVTKRRNNRHLGDKPYLDSTEGL